MSALSKYYIHLHAENYTKYGIYRSYDSPSEPNLDNIFDGYRDIVNNRIKSVIGLNIEEIESITEKSALAKELEAYYQDLYFGNANAGIRSQLEQIFNQQLAPDAIVNANNLLISETINENDFSAFQAKFRLESENLLSYLSQVKSMTREKLRPVIQKLKINLEQVPLNEVIMNDPNSGKAITAKMFSDSVRELEHIMNSSTNSKYIHVASLGRDSGSMNWETFKLCANYFTSTASTIAFNQGQIGEWAAAVAGACKSYCGRTLAEAELKTMLDQVVSQMKNNVVGSSYVFMEFLPDQGLGTAQSRSKQSLANTVGKDGVQASIRGHVSKVDVNLSYLSNDGEQMNIPLSVKNYNSFTGMTLVSGTPLSTIVEYIGGEPHAYHVLNVYTHSAELGGYKEIIDKYLYNYAVTIALTGYAEKYMPKIFLVFNNNTKQVRCYDMKFLLAKALSKDENYRAHVHGIQMSMVPSNNDGSLADEIEERHNQVFAAYQAQKVDVHLSLLSAMQ